MDDLISRQAAIAEFDRCELTPDGGIDVNYAIDYLKRLPSAQQWTPCSEGLPRKNGRYLVTRGLNACGSLWNRTYIANYSDLMGLISEKIWWQGNVGKSDFEQLDDVLAWMPMSEPWKGEE